MYLDKILNTAYSFAAAIVVFGAWAKLEHKDFGSLALTIGLLVESGIFFIYGLVEWRHPGRDAKPVETLSDPSTAGHPHPLADPRIADPRITDPRITDPRITDPRIADPQTIDQLKQTMEKTNGILKKIFRAAEL